MNKSGEEARTESQLTKGMGKALGSIPPPAPMDKLGTMAHISSHRRQLVETGESEIPSSSAVYQVKTGLEYMRPCLKKKKKSKSKGMQTEIERWISPGSAYCSVET